MTVAGYLSVLSGTCSTIHSVWDPSDYFEACHGTIMTRTGSGTGGIATRENLNHL